LDLTENQIRILQFIHDSKNHCISGSDLVKLEKNFPELEDELQRFINDDIVEFELKENKYYLAYDGFEILENKNRLTINRISDRDQYEEIVKSFGGIKQFQRMAIISILSFSVLFTILYYLNPNILNDYQKEPKDLIEESILEKMKIEAQEVFDSIQDSKKIEKKDLEEIQK